MIRDLLCKWLNCASDCEEALAECETSRASLVSQLDRAEEIIRQLELLVPRPPPPYIDYVVEKDSAWIQQVILSTGLEIIRLPLDAKYYLTNQKNFLNIVAWDWTDSMKYVRDKFDCENFAIMFKSHIDKYFELNQVGIVIDYKSGHGYNLVIYPDGNMQVLEPQNDALYCWTKRPEKFYSLRGAIVLI